jgi:hypothetical protein
VSGLEDEFRAAWTSLYESIDPDDYPKYKERARARIKREFGYLGRNMDLIVDGQLLTEIMIIEMAILIGQKTHMDEVTYDRLMSDRQHQLDLLNKDEFWIDTNEDTIEDEEEVEPAEYILFRQRGIM